MELFEQYDVDGHAAGELNENSHQLFFYYDKSLGI
jgi:hypothetical protein